MADGVRSSSRNTRGLFRQMQKISSADLVWGHQNLKKKKTTASKDYFPVERLVSKRTTRSTTQFLIKWKGFSAFFNSWEDEENLTTDLIRSYNKPNISQERLIQNIDALRGSILAKLKNKNRGNFILDFNYDCLRFLFHGKGREARQKGHILLEKTDFDRCKFPENWDVVCDIQGKLQEDQRMLIEKLSLDFSRQPCTFVP
ncbi:uncharacterized protein LOC111333421 [Stylophora pistillata]|uniref:uncharacterized protein LOC111333421 n=1 Tax=Stylophora pistillata TaxID=50429 RepID=UPI000C04CAE9|nr:uncharacterized protein LOC111333421 [Stylophora pistillata]